MQKFLSSATIRLIIMAYAYTVAAFTVFNLLPLLTGTLIDYLSFSMESAGLIGSIELGAMALTSLLCSAYFSRIEKSINIHRWAGRAFIGLILCNLLATQISDFNWLAMVRFSAGIGAGILYSLTNACIAQNQEPDRVFAAVEVLSALTAVVLVVVVPFAIESWQQKGVFLLAIIVALLFAPLIRLGPGELVQTTNELHISRGQLYSSDSLILLFGSFLLMMSQGALWTFVERLGHKVGLSTDDIGLMLAGSAIMGVAGAASVAWLGIRWGRLVPTMISICVLSFSSFTLSQTNNPVVFIASDFLFAYSFMFLWPILLGTASALDDIGSVAVAMGGMSLLGIAAGPAVGGLLISATGQLSSLGQLTLVCGLTALALLFYVLNKLENESKFTI